MSESPDRFAAFTREERAAIHHALWAGAYTSTPYPGDCGLWYPKSVYKTCEDLLVDLGDDAPVGILDADPNPEVDNPPFEMEDKDAEYHASRGFNPGPPSELRG